MGMSLTYQESYVWKSELARDRRSWRSRLGLSLDERLQSGEKKGREGFVTTASENGPSIASTVRFLCVCGWHYMDLRAIVCMFTARPAAASSAQRPLDCMVALQSLSSTPGSLLPAKSSWCILQYNMRFAATFRCRPTCVPQGTMLAAEGTDRALLHWSQKRGGMTVNVVRQTN